MIARLVLVTLFAAILPACVSFPDAPPKNFAPHIEDGFVVSVDGARLGLDQWPAKNAKAAIVAVHGMNDYSAAFTYAGPYWSAHGISVFAYDQRGFGRSVDFGRWPGGDALRQDLRAVIAAVRAQNPGLPVYVAGHSMGSSLIMTAMREAPLDVDGVILGAPGVWGGAGMSIFYRAALNIAATFAPGKTLTGERAGRQASDNIEFLRRMYEDPLVIKATRLDAILGVERLMGEAYAASDDIRGDILMLYGEKDDIIPVGLLEKTAGRLRDTSDILVFKDGWHMIFADLEREIPLQAVADWIAADLAE
ncbi:MAG: alpha/beta fold hydrolase [Parvularculaceae bacterium]|nr:lysophospholipase [Parvularculaceae bacterium]